LDSGFLSNWKYVFSVTFRLLKGKRSFIDHSVLYVPRSIKSDIYSRNLVKPLEKALYNNKVLKRKIPYYTRLKLYMYLNKVKSSVYKLNRLKSIVKYMETYYKNKKNVIFGKSNVKIKYEFKKKIIPTNQLSSINNNKLLLKLKKQNKIDFETILKQDITKYGYRLNHFRMSKKKNKIFLNEMRWKNTKRNSNINSLKKFVSQKKVVFFKKNNRNQYNFNKINNVKELNLKSKVKRIEDKSSIPLIKRNYKLYNLYFKQISKMKRKINYNIYKFISRGSFLNGVHNYGININNKLNYLKPKNIFDMDSSKLNSSLIGEATLRRFIKKTNFNYDKSKTLPPLEKLHLYDLMVPEDKLAPKDPKREILSKIRTPKTAILSSLNHRKIVNAIFLRVIFLSLKSFSIIKLSKLEVDTFLRRSAHLFIIYLHYLKVREIPGGVFFFNEYNIDTILTETNAFHLPVISLADTNTNVNLMSYPIPSNDNSIALNAFYCLLLFKLITRVEFNDLVSPDMFPDMSRLKRDFKHWKMNITKSSKKYIISSLK